MRAGIGGMSAGGGVAGTGGGVGLKPTSQQLLIDVAHAALDRWSDAALVV